jgi:serine/threonine-protein kinase
VAKVRLLDPKDGKRRLDRYELIGELASGGMATVFLARLGGVGGFQRFVAIKRLHPHLANEQDFIEMFLDEARLAAGIHHPHVVPILEVGESDSGYYLVMEYVEGDTLARLMARALARAHPIPRPVLVRMILDTLAGLHAAHELVDASGNPVQLVHRDVSPQNVLIGVDGCSRITDFGVAHAASRLQNTRTDRLKGKLAYMSPEQARAGEVDRRADIFAMGVILWEVLAAKRLFKGENEAITLQRVTVEPIPRLASVVPGMHPALDQVCSTALERDRDKRFASAADMAEALERAARIAATDSATDLGVASPREVAAYVQAALGEDIAAQRESVRAWLAHSEPSNPRGGVKPGDHGRPPGYDVTMTMPLDRDVARIAAIGIGPGAPQRRFREETPPRLSRTPMYAGAMADGAAAEGHHAESRQEPSYSGSRSFPSAEALTADGANASEAPVEPVDDDDDDEHETALMNREEASNVVTALVNRKQTASAPPPMPRGSDPPRRQSAPSSPPAQQRQASIVAPFSAEDGTPSKSIESYMVPARPTPNRTPQLVAVVIAVLMTAVGLIAWSKLRADGQTARPLAPDATATTLSAPPTGAAAAGPPATATATPPPPATTPSAPALPPPIALSSLPSVGDTPDAGAGFRGKGKGKGKGKKGEPAPATPEPAASPEPPPPAPVQPPSEPKVPEDMPNPYR